MPGTATIRSSLVLGTAALALAACGGGGGGGGDPIGPPAANIVGHYTVTHTGTLSGLPAISCPGDIDITNQTGNSFSGTISVDVTTGCEGFAGSGTIDGTLTTGGAFEATITIPALNELLASLNCTIVGGDSTFTGSAGTAGISAGRSVDLNCEIEGGTLETTLEYTVVGPKT
ncbi:MAG TPA: hypothetical protein VJ982_07870 [Gemmatimonadota bacterium]|nr:hypothetical protein [Gemmatimonadota bacterium]